ncbi:hypothetical protein F9H64_17660 [Vibrio parahaemolyticus]|nr:hypothetical protein [Vibrio parahaemolyticus]EGQ9346949.1 hypothetical protein [Vibrio parahaemolyticus]EGQ9837350.1 hypothetical protein [Vibrio parahaemolyticus]EGR0269720.1 hypothetical protein [Vibrio parahaemolyticus]EGR0362195.1 hypothetical protein [Vibrio parahaemolyticus]
MNLPHHGYFRRLLYHKCKNYVSFFPNSFLIIFRRSVKRHNAALSGEQRRLPNLKYCAVNTKAESN